MKIKQLVKKIEKYTPGLSKKYYAGLLCERLKIHDNQDAFKKNAIPQIKVFYRKNKEKQVCEMLDRISINPCKNNFFYSIDEFAFFMPNRGKSIFNNFTPNYESVINGLDEDKTLVKEVRNYLTRAAYKCENTHQKELISIVSKNIGQPSSGFEEALQRILIFNQLFWQTGHTLVGVGHLDWLLGDLFDRDLENGKMDEDLARYLLCQFFEALHYNYAYKSNCILGDTGQIIILGGNLSDNEYHCNRLTYMILECVKDMQLPDPKVLVRVGDNMPCELLELCIECMSTGIGSPLLSNDEVVIPRMIEFGYSKEDSYNYGVSACWEPLAMGVSFDNNNFSSVNFAEPISQMIEKKLLLNCRSMDEVWVIYEELLKRQIDNLIQFAQSREYEYDPLNTMLIVNGNGRDFCHGGAKYNNTGFTSVGIATATNSLLNIKQLVYNAKVYKMEEVIDACNSNYQDDEKMYTKLRNMSPQFGEDDEEIIKYTNRIMKIASDELKKYRTKNGGKYKIGFSSPSYIDLGKSTGTTFDGRRTGEAFETHISSKCCVAYTDILRFASKLSYKDNVINGNVVDLIVPRLLISDNLNKFVVLIKNAMRIHVYQMQMNVIDSKILIEARNNPDKFPNLIVRVWGFSAYFKDIPEEYKMLIIQRAIEAEKLI